MDMRQTEELSLSGIDYKKDDDNIKGLIRWQFEMKPKEKKEIKLGWTVNWPKDHKLMGLQ